MKIQDLLRENNITLSSKGRACLILAIKDVYPILKIMDERVVGRFIWAYDLNDEDCLRILHLTIRYAKLWAFS